MKIRKNTQLSLINLKRAGRPAIHDSGIRHTTRPLLTKKSSLHLTVKVKSNKAEMKNKLVLSILKRAIMNARLKGLKVIHFSLEYDHVHLLIEADNNAILGKGMQAFGVTFSKAINKVRKMRGGVYKHRYHFRKINSGRELKNVMSYIFNNGLKHKTANTLINPFNSIKAEKKYYLFSKTKFDFDLDLVRLLDQCSVYYQALDYI